MRKLAPPLGKQASLSSETKFIADRHTVTLVSSAPEVQWVALRNINLILQKRPDVLSNEMRVFFCKYNDPSYVKLEKLDIMVKLSTDKNIDTLLSELKEYASEVDYDFVKKAIRAIGQCAIKIDSAGEKCVNVLLDLIATRVSYVVQEAIIVIKVGICTFLREFLNFKEKADSHTFSRTSSANTRNGTKELSRRSVRI
jgi:vesicle coat complex subunit